MVTASRTVRIVLATGAALAVVLPVAAQDAAKVKQGQQVYAAQKCQGCHAIGGKGSKANPLDGVGAKLSADEIRQWITDPKGMSTKANSTKKPPMPAKYGSLSAADLDSLVAYMQSLK